MHWRKRPSMAKEFDAFAERALTYTGWENSGTRLLVLKSLRELKGWLMSVRPTISDRSKHRTGSRSRREKLVPDSTILSTWAPLIEASRKRQQKSGKLRLPKTYHPNEYTPPAKSVQNISGLPTSRRKSKK